MNRRTPGLPMEWRDHDLAENFALIKKVVPVDLIVVLLKFFFSIRVSFNFQKFSYQAPTPPRKVRGVHLCAFVLFCFSSPFFRFWPCLIKQMKQSKVVSDKCQN